MIDGINSGKLQPSAAYSNGPQLDGAIEYSAYSFEHGQIGTWDGMPAFAEDLYVNEHIAPQESIEANPTLDPVSIGTSAFTGGVTAVARMGDDALTVATRSLARGAGGLRQATSVTRSGANSFVLGIGVDGARTSVSVTRGTGAFLNSIAQSQQSISAARTFLGGFSRGALWGYAQNLAGLDFASPNAHGTCGVDMSCAE
jgi:hypothetical protein